MEYASKIKLGMEVSFVVCATDGFTGRNAAGGIMDVFVRNVPVKPVRKHDGYYVFTRLPGGQYEIVVESDRYFNESIIVSTGELENKERTVFVPLMPRPSYNFPGGTTLIRSTLVDKKSRPAVNADVKAVVLSEDCAWARLSREGARQGNSSISLVDICGLIAAGDSFMIKDKANTELCRISKIDENIRSFGLKQPLEYSYERGALLLPVVYSKANENGEIAVYFRNLRKKVIDVELEFLFEGNVSSKTLRIEEGKTALTGMITV
jgi:hypothetical protein